MPCHPREGGGQAGIHVFEKPGFPLPACAGTSFAGMTKMELFSVSLTKDYSLLSKQQVKSKSASRKGTLMRIEINHHGQSLLLSGKKV